MKLWYIFPLCLFLTLSACDNGSGPDPDPDMDILETRKAVIANIGSEIIIPAYEDLGDQVGILNTTVEAFIQAPDLTGLSEAQNALKAVWLSWQDASLFLFGPSEKVSLRSAMATYPTDRDKIEANISSGDYILSSIDNQSAVGLPAMDYLLNGQADTQEEILDLFSTDPNAWNRKQYLVDLKDDIANRVQETHNSWVQSSGNHLAEFTAETALGTDVGSSLGLLINALDLHYQRFVRDGKVAIPVGIRSAGVPRPAAAEALYGGYSIELLVASLQAYQRLMMGITYTGEDKEGLYEYLVALDAKELGDDMNEQFTVTISTAQAIADPLSEQISTDPAPVEALFLEMQKIVILLKSDMASTMGITITNQDNDGD